MKADSDEKFIVIQVNAGTNGGYDTSSDGVFVDEIKSADLRSRADRAGQNRDGDTVRFVGTEDKTWDESYYLVNTSGNIQKNKTASKDGDDWYFYLDGERIVMYTNNNVIRGDSTHTMDIDLSKWNDWSASSDTYDPLASSSN